MEAFLSCDWGTSAFRLRVIDTGNLSILAEEHTAQGSADTYAIWQKSGLPPSDRLSFYRQIIQQHMEELEKKLNTSLSGLPVVISGMASSSIGMMEVPYKELPFSIDGTDLPLHIAEPDSTFHHRMIIISGIRSPDDVMRGEETKLVGCSFNTAPPEEQLYLFPGTHSKHVTVKNGKALQFKTYMTGEFFDVLTKESILSASVEAGDIAAGNNRKSFEAGVQQSLQDDLLHSAFLVRTNDLFHKLNKEENYCYLSGLLIGTELKQYIGKNRMSMAVICGDKLKPYYEAALQTLKITDNVSLQPADQMLIQGQYIVYKNVANNQ